ncbi:acetate/propionate family kinase, partial [Anaerolineae bacterium CFX7]|nr:acetate/propionate family kinase [Anaerolineae bacterium CFX7]
IVHGGPRFAEPERVTAALLDELEKISPYAPEHLPIELSLIRALAAYDPAVPQIVCFDTAFHRTLPRVAQILPIPRRYFARGVMRYGFHGLSYQYLMSELERVAGQAAARGRVILAHLGNGASMAAVRDGKSVDTSMAFTPTAGLVMSTRSGDLDPGLVEYLARNEAVSAQEFYQIVHAESGLRGISETSSDMRDLLARENADERAADATALFCRQAKKFIGAYAAVLGGVETLVFAGGIGEKSAIIRQRICEGLEFLGIEIDDARNEAHAPIISTHGARVTVRVIRTDEELEIARLVQRMHTL